MKKRHISPLNLILKSAVFRLAFIMFIIIVPVCILTMVMSSRAIIMAENQVSDDIREALNLNMNQLDNYLQNIGRRLYTLSRENDDYVRLMDSEQGNDVDNMHSYMRLQGVLTNIQSEYTWADNIFAYFPSADFFVSSKGYMSPEEGNVFLDEINRDGTMVSEQWSTASNDENYLIRVFRYKNSYYGAGFRLDNLLDNIIKMDTSSNIVRFEKEDNIIQDENITINGEKYVRIESVSQHSNLVLADYISRNYLDSTLPGYMRVLFIISIVFLVCIPLLFIAFMKWLVRPVNILIDAINYVDQGDLDYRISQKAGTYEFDLLNNNFNDMMDSVKDLKINIYEKELERQNIRLQYLSQQIQPHFILNAMNIIYSYEPDEYDLIQKMVLCLSRYFQFIVNANRPYVKINEEMNHISNYLEIQKIRYGSRIEYEVNTEEEAGEAVMPPLMVQNLVENVIKYALKDDETVKISISACCQDNKITIEISDTGCGIKDEILDLIKKFEQTKQRQEGLGTGIQNTIERLELFFGNDAVFRAGRGDNNTGTKITMIFPVKNEDGV